MMANTIPWKVPQSAITNDQDLEGSPICMIEEASEIVNKNRTPRRRASVWNPTVARHCFKLTGKDIYKDKTLSTGLGQASDEPKNPFEEGNDDESVTTDDAKTLIETGIKSLQNLQVSLKDGFEMMRLMEEDYPSPRECI